MKFTWFLIALLAIAIIGCQETDSIDPLDAGQDFTNSNVRVLEIDTLSVVMTTFKFDSIVTSNSNRILIGQYDDEFFGQTRASSYFELTPQSYEIPDEAELDSVGLVLGYDRYYYSDTLRLMTINVHRLTDELNTDDDFFYNTSEITFEPSPLASLTLRPRPSEDSLYIPLPLSLGDDIFNNIQDNIIENDNDLRQVFKGLTIQPAETDNASILGFSKLQTLTYLRFFYSIPDDTDDNSAEFDLRISTTTTTPTSFNNIASLPATNGLDQLVDQEVNLPSTASGNRTFIQSGVGIATRLQFPSVKDLLDLPGDGTLLGATLRIKPTDFQEELFPIRDSLNVSIVDQNNSITRALENGLGMVFATLGDEENEEVEEFDEIYYDIPVGVYVEQKILETAFIDDAIIVFGNNFNETVDRNILQGEQSETFEAKLTITYALYE